MFFPSYSVLDVCMKFWEATEPDGKLSIMDRIRRIKQTVVETRGSTEFNALVDDFAAKLKDERYKGAVFFAVCRGKVSEGLDFSDAQGRAVVVTGLPYPSLTDAKVDQKKKYLDSAPRQQGIKRLSGTEWYTQQALRAINQAIGRVIRHRQDFGAILLCDERFAQPNIKTALSLWIRPQLQTCATFGKACAGLSAFFKSCRTAGLEEAAAERKVEKEKKQKTLLEKKNEWRNRTVIRKSSSSSSSNSSSSERRTLPTVSEDLAESYAALQGGLGGQPAPVPAPPKAALGEPAERKGLLNLLESSQKQLQVAAAPAPQKAPFASDDGVRVYAAKLSLSERLAQSSAAS